MLLLTMTCLNVSLWNALPSSSAFFTIICHAVDWVEKSKLRMFNIQIKTKLW